MSKEIFGIRDHIAQDSPDSARRMMIRFVKAFRLLAKRPELGQVRDDLLTPRIRCWPVGAYLILYSGAKIPIEIVAVVHAARDVSAVLNRRTAP